MIGKTLSHYKVLEKIGQGGMGEVYRAEDTNLSRDVAIKVLPEQFTQDPQRLARFEREAKLLASLNHPNIAAIHSFEHSDDIHFLVLELVPGDTLQERVAKGPLPVEEALEVCRQIAEGVEAAHEKGVIHRDLKPANVKVTPEGKVKILDFGLAKAFEDEIPAADISQSPTLTEEMTRAGVILGTAAYMSPEQAKGKPVDKRADVFAFGAVLYELLAGKRAFEGETITETIAAVLKSEPDWEGLPGDTPWRIQDLLRRCLTKDPHDRVHEIADVRIEVKLALSEPTTVLPMGVGGAAQPPLWRKAIPWSLASLVVGGIIAGLLTWSLKPPPPITRSVTRFPMVLPSIDLTIPTRSVVDISPDGERLVYTSSRQLYLREMNQLEARPIPGTEGGFAPFFSPDSQWVGFFMGTEVKKVSISGGASLTLCDATQTPITGAWGPNDTIVYGISGGTGLFQVSAAGGTPQPLTELDTEKGEGDHDWPQILPDGKAMLFTISTAGTGYGNAQIVVQSLETGERRVLVRGGTYARYVPTGHLVYVQAGTLLVVPFDLTKLEVTGPPTPVLEGVMQSEASGVAHFSLSRHGSLIYLAGTISTSLSLVWVDREGGTQPVTEIQRGYESPRFSPDGTRLSVSLVDAGLNIWLYEIERGILTPFTFEGINLWAIWTPDGKRLTYSSNKGGGQVNIFSMPVDGSGQEEQLIASELRQVATSWSPHNVLAYTEDSVNQGDIWVLPQEGERKPQPFLVTQFHERQAVFSPDGGWIAFTSDRSGQDEVYAKAYPSEGGIVQISTDGGSGPVWSRNGKELFYRSGDRMMSVIVQTEPTFKAERPQLLFEGSYRYSRFGSVNYDVTPEGQRFVMVKEGDQETEPPQINVVLNWGEELKRLVPAN